MNRIAEGQRAIEILVDAGILLPRGRLLGGRADGAIGGVLRVHAAGGEGQAAREQTMDVRRADHISEYAASTAASWERTKGHRFSGAGGLASGVENLHDDDVGVERGEVVVGLELAADDGGEVVQGRVLGRREWRDLEGDFRRGFADAFANQRGIDGDGVALRAVDFGIFAAEGPVPGRHEHGLRACG